jgi:hypothetical protein
MGDHYSEWNPLKGEIVQTYPTDNKTRIVVNQALACARTELAKMAKSRPQMEVMAKSNESEDISAAKVGKFALDSLEWKFSLGKLKKDALWWMIATGTAAIYVGWDSMSTRDGTKTYIIDPETGEPVFAPYRLDELKKLKDSGMIDEVPQEEFPLGDVEYKVYSSFQMLPDETTLSLDQMTNLIVSDVVDIDVAKGTWGAAADDLQPEPVALGTLEKRMISRLNLATVTNPPPVENACQVHTMWLVPGIYNNGYLDRGVMLRWSQDTILEISIDADSKPVFPFIDGRLPFSYFTHIQNNTSIWADSIMQHIRPLNLEIDKIMSQMIEAKDHMANPMWLVATQHQIKGQIKNQAGGIVRYVHVPNVPPPTPVQGAQMPPQVEELSVVLRQQILEISGQSEPTRGRMPAGVRSGVQIAYMQEEDDTKIAPTIENMETAIALMSSLSLCRLGQYYTTERFLRVYRSDGIWDIRKFRGAALKGNTDVIPIAGSGLPKSKAAKQQFTLEMAQLGLIKDPRQIMQALDIGEGEPDETDKDIAQADRENGMMMFGWKMKGEAQAAGHDEHKPVAVPVKAWHNHQVHIDRHTSIMKDPEFDELTQTQPEIPRVFDEHIAMHQQAIQQQQMQQMQQMLAAKQAMQQATAPGPPQGNGAGPPGALAQTQQLSSMDVPDVAGQGMLNLTARSMSPPGGG